MEERRSFRTSGKEGQKEKKGKGAGNMNIEGTGRGEGEGPGKSILPDVCSHCLNQGHREAQCRKKISA